MFFLFLVWRLDWIKKKEDQKQLSNEETIENEKIENEGFLTSVFGKEKQDEIADALMGKDIFSNRLVKKNTIYNRTRMSNFGIKLSKLYSQMSTWKLVLITTITAIFFGVISVFFVKNVSVYNFGLGAFGQNLQDLL
ncbi:hypothetical protein [Mycoplasmopsis cynos]|uniref:hypothetical protein n=1 Tax=Mycoplasmopsis cynos TaxID=171284 RepID=UPI0021FCB071|nr:hypothetical protein [Mycoplasmopsis cynos]UWV81350.1 hypothetical protein NW065_05370 [Mycoplasmopsis cynos]